MNPESSRLLGLRSTVGTATNDSTHSNGDPDIHHGVPVVTGTRVPVSIMIGSLAGGMNKEDVCQEYDLSMEAVESELAYAAEVITATEVISLVGD